MTQNLKIKLVRGEDGKLREWVSEPDRYLRYKGLAKDFQLSAEQLVNEITQKEENNGISKKYN